MFRIAAVAALCACTGVQQRFPDDVQAGLAHEDMRRIETDRFVIYYSAPRRGEVERFLLRANRCAEVLRNEAVIRSGAWDEKIVILMPDVPFNNAFVVPQLEGYEQISVIPTTATLDFTTEFGLPPDPGYIACHELVHYVHEQQLGGFWGRVDQVLGHIYNPQLGYDPWFFEGLATHYEAKLSPGVGRPQWPIFTGFFAAGYAGHHVGGGDLSSLGRLATMGHHYLVGTMFVKFLTERYGERALWIAIAVQSHALTGWFFPGTFKAGFGVSFGDLLDQFDAWAAQTYPVRYPPPGQHRLALVGNDARYARGRDGTEAWVADEVDLPPRLVVRDPHGATLAEIALVDVLPPRTLVQADPLLVSGLSVTADGNEVWFTVVDLGTTYQETRLVRWRRGDTKITEIATELGPGATIDPSGRIYYHCAVDGDRWSLAAWDTHTGARRTILAMQPGTYVLGAQVSPDGAQLVANVWDGTAFVAWVIDAATGAVTRRIPGVAYDASFTSDGRVMWLGVIDGRFQVIVDGVAATDAPYTVLAAREAGGTIRFLDREGWDWDLAEVAAPPPGPPSVTPPPAPPPPQLHPVTIDSDVPYCPWERFWYPQERAPAIVYVDNALLVGGVLAGGDRLGLQRWSVAGYAQPFPPPGGDVRFGAQAAYLNTMLAPTSIIAQGSWLDGSSPVTSTDGKTTLDEERRTRDASLTIERVWRGALTAAASAIYSDDYDRPPGEAPLRRHVGGPQLAFSWLSGESTRYTDLHRGLAFGGFVASYPRALSTFDGDIEDVGGYVGAITPLPFGRRHVLTAEVRGRALVARDDTGLLQLGGQAPIAILWNGSSVATTPEFDDTRFPPNQRFVEPLRGYEDYAITTDRAAIGDLSWRYPLIIDRGVAATAWILPATFVRELDLEAFGAGAIDKAGDRHLAAGGAVSLRIELLRIPVIITYQLARRLADDRALTQLVGLAPDL